MIQRLRTIDAHVGGQPLRLIVEGVPRPRGRTIAHKGGWLARHADEVRRAVVLEPRGHTDMVAAVLTDPVSPEAHAGLVFMDARGYPPLAGHGIIAAATIAVERQLVVGRSEEGSGVRLVFDTTAGAIHTRVHSEGPAGVHRTHSVAFTNVPSFVHTPAHPVHLGTRHLNVDVAYAGTFFAIVDAEATGIPLRPERLSDVRRLGVDIAAALNAASEFAHPVDPHVGGIKGVVFTGPPFDPEAHLRSVVVTGGVVDRSPNGTATAAVMAVLDAMGLLVDDQPFVHESVTGTLFRGNTLRRTVVGDLPALVAEIEGSAWITGEHTFLVDEDDPFREGFSF